MNALPTVKDALAMAERGWAVLPLNGKMPIRRLTPHGFKDATSDPDTVRYYFQQPHNIGVVIPSQLLVLDFDPRNGGTVESLEAAAGVRLPSTLSVMSGRGDGGQHRYFLHPGGELRAHFPTDRGLKGIDIKRGDTGYCVAPPSIHPATQRAYEWVPYPAVPLPAAVVALLRPAKPPAPTLSPRPSATTSSPHPARSAALIRTVLNAAEGRRNDVTFWAASSAIRDGLGEATLHDIAEAATQTGLTESEVTKVVLSARRKAGGAS